MSLVSVLRRSFSRPSNWKFITSSGLDVSGWIITGTISNLIVEEETIKQRCWLRYVAIGASIGAPAGLDLSTTDMASAGLIYLGPNCTSDALQPSDFAGGCLVVSAGYSNFRGVAGNVILFGANEGRLALCQILNTYTAMTGPIGYALLNDPLWDSFKGVAAFGGANAGATGGAGVMRGHMYVDRIGLPELEMPEPEQLPRIQVPPPTPSVIVSRGDSLSALAKRFYGSFDLWPILWDANRDLISNPNKLTVGTLLYVPPLSSFTPAQIQQAKSRAPTWRSYAH